MKTAERNVDANTCTSTVILIIRKILLQAQWWYDMWYGTEISHKTQYHVKFSNRTRNRTEMFNFLLPKVLTK